MRKQIAQLLAICLILLTGNFPCIAQEKQSAAEEKASVAEEKQAAAEEKRAAAKALDEQKRVLAQQKRAAEREKRFAEREKRIAAQIATKQKRSLEEALRQAAHPDGTFKLLESRLGSRMSKVVKGAPYSATAITEHTQTLSDGNQIIQKNEAIYYRDSEGRTRIDQKLKTIGKWTTAGDPPRMITILDPVAGNYYSLDPQTRTALMDARRLQKVPTGPIGPSGLIAPKGPTGPKGLNGPGELNGPNGPTGPKDLIGPKVLNGPKPGPFPKKAEADQHIVPHKSLEKEKKKESLGTRVIEGVSAEGTRSTVTIPAGEIGNVAPIEIVDENWYSPELQVPVLTRHHDPRSGDTIYRLTNINRSEPDRSLFEVPADYRLLDRRAPKLPREPKQPTIAEPPRKTEIEL